ncbi:hypothetical protein L1987_35124 [Smallanthus sonchifolius]|uniref:Uncharacterized protein n=1 Tax=Smallanthus sonchifolius TaxID=185202 RepID=A0ACB9HXG7_9ASTR|nr:hypothetical protein L1987_35124 [Smallanthus sonchifolius]
MLSEYDTKKTEQEAEKHKEEDEGQRKKGRNIRDTYTPKDYTGSIIPVQIAINSGNQCGITTILGLNDANKYYIQIKV